MSEPISLAEVERQFRDPPARYGPVDCWWWEAARLDRARLREQLESLKEQGVSGTWFYPRWVGGEPLRSDPPYWSEEWWDLTRFSLDEHERLGLISWFSDWTAHGEFQSRVREESLGPRPEFGGRRLVLYEKRTTIGGPEREGVQDWEKIQHSEPRGPVQIEVPVDEEILHAAAYRPAGGGIDQGTRVPLEQACSGNRLRWLPPGHDDWIVAVVTAQPHDLDYLNPAVADRWIELLLGRYERELPGHVGSTLQAYGPDEMYVLNGNILYSGGVVERLRAQKGYDPLPLLAGLFLDIGRETERIRCDYLATMVDLLDESFYRRVADRLHDRGMRYTTIATWGREDPIEQTFHYGDFFRMMRHFDVTGNEDPRDCEVHRRRFLDSKFSSSIAHLNRREQAMVCGYWNSGWGVTQEQNLAFTGANYAFGINLYNRHGGLYSLLGGWYEWVPPAIHFHQPYWSYWRRFADLVRRLSWAMSQGVHVADVALLYPLTTMHAGWTGGGRFSSEAREAAAACMDLARAVYYSGIDFDFVDEASVAGAGCGRGRLTIAGIGFPAVVLPPLAAIPRGVLRKLRDHCRSGGTVVALGRLPTASPEAGRGDPVLQRLLAETFGPGADQFRTDAVREHPGGGRGVFVPGRSDGVVARLRELVDLDVSCRQPDLFHTHQRLPGGEDVYLLFNASEKERRIDCSLRSSGEPRIWDPATGTVRPLHRFERRGSRTLLSLDMGPFETAVVSLEEGGERPGISRDNLDTVTRVAAADTEVRVEGLSGAGGRAEVRIQDGGSLLRADAEVEAPPPAIRLDRPWDFRLEPLLDNRWGDYRYPASDRVIGPEARRFRYREETAAEDAASWTQPGFDDGEWTQAAFTCGPFWWTLGPFRAASEPEEVLRQVTSEGFDPSARFRGAQEYGWSPVEVSEQFGTPESGGEFGGLAGVSDEFLHCGAVPGETDAVRWFAAIVDADAAGNWQLHAGAGSDFTASAWVNGDPVLADVREPASSGPVRLQAGRNEVVLRILQPGGARVRAWAAFSTPGHPPPGDPYVPLLRWFRDPPPLLFDVTPGARRAGWFRFDAPPGLAGMQMQLYGRRLEVWVDGEPVCTRAVDCNPRERRPAAVEVTLAAPRPLPSQVAVRVEMAESRYGGAVFAAPVAFRCGPGSCPTGDWCSYGLSEYSGAAVYSTTAVLEARHLDGAVRLDLGRAGIIADVSVNGEAAGVLMARPYRLDVTGLVREGANGIEVKVVNTLANHMSSYPTRHVLTGQTVSGLLGPVELQFLRRVELRAPRG